MMKKIVFTCVIIAVLSCACRNNKTDVIQEPGITAEMAYEGVNDYCHSAYDWSAVDNNPDLMYLQMGEETDSAYQIVFRSYTGTFVYFYVNKTSGTTRMEEYVPALGIRSDAGTIELFDYIRKEKIENK